MHRMSQPVSILMPVRNEASIIAEVVEEWHRDVFAHLPEESELLFDDGASTDGTLEILEKLGQTHRYIRVICSKRDGFAAAARRLYAAARCPLIFFTDSDGQYIPAEFWNLAPFIDQFDIVHGAKVGRQDAFFRCVASNCFNAISRWQFATRINDVNSAFRLMKRSVVSEMLPQLHCMPSLLNAELLLRAAASGYAVKQIDVPHRPRKHGFSRGLPLSSFLSECMKAYRGLRQLKHELSASRAAPQQTRGTLLADVKNER